MLDQAAKNLLSEAEAELASMKDRLRALEPLIASLRSFTDQSSPSTKPERAAGPARVGSKRHRIEVAIEQCLREAAGPVHRMKIKEHLVQLGVVGDEENPLRVVSRALTRSNKFQKHGKGYWGLAATQAPNGPVQFPHDSKTEADASQEAR